MPENTNNNLEGTCWGGSSGKLGAHYLTMVTYIALSIWVLVSTKEASTIAAGSILLAFSVLGCVPLFMWHRRLKM